MICPCLITAHVKCSLCKNKTMYCFFGLIWISWSPVIFCIEYFWWSAIVFFTRSSNSWNVSPRDFLPEPMSESVSSFVSGALIFYFGKFFSRSLLIAFSARLGRPTFFSYICGGVLDLTPVTLISSPNGTSYAALSFSIWALGSSIVWIASVTFVSCLRYLSIFFWISSCSSSSAFFFASRARAWYLFILFANLVRASYN